MATQQTLTLLLVVRIHPSLPSPYGLIPLSVFKVGEKSSALKMVGGYSYCNMKNSNIWLVILQYEYLCRKYA